MTEERIETIVRMVSNNEMGIGDACEQLTHLLSKQPSEASELEDDINFHARANALTPTKEST